MTPPPTIPGYNITWFDDFNYQGTPNSAKWSIETPATNNNGEQQKYTNSTENAYVDRAQLYIVPVKKDNGWTSARMHGNVNFQCDPGKKAIIAARIKVGQNSPAQQQGIWPAFWTLGSSVGQIGWPKCCEWDILELGNGNSWSQGTCHQEVNGQHYQTDQKIDFNRAEYHTWAVEVDLTSDDYFQEKLSWQLDGNTFFEVKCMGQDAESRACWERCARSSFYPILNVAVGGNFVGEIGPEMIGGVESGLTVAWVATYNIINEIKMGIPYSKEINTAFVELNKAYGQVTPLVAAAYEVLETSKNITLLVAAVQVFNTVLLSCILMCMLGLLITMNPDLENERKELITPVMLWIAGWAGLAKRIAGTVVFLVLMLVIGGVMMTRREGKGPVESIEAGEVQEGGEKEGGEEGEDGEEGVEGTVKKAEQNESSEVPQPRSRCELM